MTMSCHSQRPNMSSHFMLQLFKLSVCLYVYTPSPSVCLSVCLHVCLHSLLSSFLSIPLLLSLWVSKRDFDHFNSLIKLTGSPEKTSCCTRVDVGEVTLKWPDIYGVTKDSDDMLTGWGRMPVHKKSGISLWKPHRGASQPLKVVLTLKRLELNFP